MCVSFPLPKSLVHCRTLPISRLLFISPCGLFNEHFSLLFAPLSLVSIINYIPHTSYTSTCSLFVAVLVSNYCYTHRNSICCYSCSFLPYQIQTIYAFPHRLKIQVSHDRKKQIILPSLQLLTSCLTNNSTMRCSCFALLRVLGLPAHGNKMFLILYFFLADIYFCVDHFGSCHLFEIVWFITTRFLCCKISTLVN